MSEVQRKYLEFMAREKEKIQKDPEGYKKFLDFMESPRGQVIAEHLVKKMQAGELPPIDEFNPADYFNKDGTVKE